MSMKKMVLLDPEVRSHEAAFGDRDSGLEARNQELGAGCQAPGVVFPTCHLRGWRRHRILCRRPL